MCELLTAVEWKVDILCNSPHAVQRLYGNASCCSQLPDAKRVALMRLQGTHVYILANDHTCSVLSRRHMIRFVVYMTVSMGRGVGLGPKTPHWCLPTKVSSVSQTVQG